MINPMKRKALARPPSVKASPDGEALYLNCRAAAFLRGNEYDRVFLAAGKDEQTGQIFLQVMDVPPGTLSVVELPFGYKRGGISRVSACRIKPEANVRYTVEEDPGLERITLTPKTGEPE